MDLEGARAAAATARVARLATIGADGFPDLVPITFALVPGADRLVSSVDHKPKTTHRLRRLDNVRARPEVGLVVDHYDDEDWTQLWWVRLEGWATVDEDLSAVAEAASLLGAKYPVYRERPPAGPVLDVALTSWRWWSAAGGTGHALVGGARRPPASPPPPED